MKKSNLYTRTGDTGTTSLVGGERVLKDNIRIESYGTIDELNSNIGMLLALIGDDNEQRATLTFVQNKLFNIGAYLATNNQDNAHTECAGLGMQAIEALERQIDILDSLVPPLRAFLLPAGGRAAAQSHICRTVCRRAERRITTLSHEAYVDPHLLRFVNRLSDYLFVFARFNSLKDNASELFWDKDCQC